MQKGSSNWLCCHHSWAQKSSPWELSTWATNESIECSYYYIIYVYVWRDILHSPRGSHMVHLCWLCPSIVPTCRSCLVRATGLVLCRNAYYWRCRYCRAGKFPGVQFSQSTVYLQQLNSQNEHICICHASLKKLNCEVLQGVYPQNWTRQKTSH